LKEENNSFNYTKGLITIKRMSIEIEKKNQFSKRTQKIKRMRIKIDIKNKNKILIKR